MRLLRKLAMELQAKFAAEVETPTERARLTQFDFEETRDGCALTIRFESHDKIEAQGYVIEDVKRLPAKDGGFPELELTGRLLE